MSDNAGYPGDLEQIDDDCRSACSPRTGLGKAGRLHEGAQGSASITTPASNAESVPGRGEPARPPGRWLNEGSSALSSPMCNDRSLARLWRSSLRAWRGSSNGVTQTR